MIGSSRVRAAFGAMLVLSGAPALADSAPPASFAAVPVGAPLVVRDQNPLIRGAYLPLPVAPFDADGWSVQATLNWSNTVNAGLRANESFLVDAESLELGLVLLGRVGEWRVRAGVPVTYRDAGVLDGFIDGWHDLFGLPEGIRPQRPKDAYAVFYERLGTVEVDAPSGTALGDVQLEAGRVLRASERGELSAWVGVELPTGRRSRLTGNGGVDASAWLAGRRQLSPLVAVTGQIGAVALGGDEPVPLRSTGAFGTVTLGWQVLPSFEAIAQLDAHSALADDSSLRFLQAATLLTLGGRIRAASGWSFEAGVTEDIAVDRSPDVTFHFGLTFR
jgi:hypothetical protein